MKRMPVIDDDQFGQSQDALALTARMWPVEETGAAIAHQLSGPLNALLLYLHEIANGSGQSVGVDATSEILERALRETERVCDIIHQMGHTFAGPAHAEAAIACGRQAIDALTRRDYPGGREPEDRPLASRRLLTTRELQVLDIIVGGASNKEGGRKLGISIRTFEVHRAHIMEKVGARNSADLVRMTICDTQSCRSVPQ